ncbi:hypothetical protein K2173_027261 [Erythroxylum novogranatense]|uniref:Cytochrome c oxidase subunit n=1 Tax=Erythroxylum novogranatense TaxID=1862640 RepID=A0AAV8U1D4_9ROSI|nr:hypothetical protein K2173_027261 [Erythroxylum novogranatense]
MATDTAPSLSEQYLLDKDGKSDVGSKPVDLSKEESAEEAPTAAIEVKTEEPAAAQESTGTTPATAEESIETTPAASSESTEAASASSEENNETAEEEKSGEGETSEEKPEIKLETAPADFRFPTTNQTRHCFTRYIEYHRCVAAKGEGAPECDKFAKYYRALCPGEWVERWNEQRENGTFPGPL